MTTANLHYQRAKFSPLWSRVCLQTRIGHGLARIAQILCGEARCGAGPARPPVARRVVAPHGRGGWWRERPPDFRRWCATGQGEMVHAKIHHLPSPSGVALSTVIPCGKAIESARKPGPLHRTQAVRHARETPTQAAPTRTRWESKQIPSRNIAKATFSGWSATERRVPALPSIPTFRHGCKGNGLDCNAIVV